jgi:hypothetical protein
MLSDNSLACILKQTGNVIPLRSAGGPRRWRPPRSAVPLGRARIASAGRTRSCRIDTEVDFPDSEREVETVSTSWSPMSRESLSAKSGSSMAEPMTFTVEADHMASMPASPHTFWPWR